VIGAIREPLTAGSIPRPHLERRDSAIVNRALAGKELAPLPEYVSNYVSSPGTRSSAGFGGYPGLALRRLTVVRVGGRMAGRCSAPASEVDGLSDGKGGRHRSFRPVFDEQFDRRAEGAALLARKTGARFEVIRTPQRGARLFGDGIRSSASGNAQPRHPPARVEDLRVVDAVCECPRAARNAQPALVPRMGPSPRAAVC